MCLSDKIDLKHKKPAYHQTNGKVEGVIRTLMEMWHSQEEFMSSDDRKKKLNDFPTIINTVKPHKNIQWINSL